MIVPRVELLTAAAYFTASGNAQAAPPGARTDAGVLDRRLAGECSEGTVACVDGNVEGSTCSAACGGACCVGHKACTYFTGEVCKDGASCMGNYACDHANVGSVVEGCSGTWACYEADIGSVVEGCHGDGACYSAVIGSVVEGCRGDYACYYADTGYPNPGPVLEGCNSDQACFEAYITPGVFGCCNTDRECYEAASLPASCPADVIPDPSTDAPSTPPSAAGTDLPTETPSATGTDLPTQAPSAAGTDLPTQAPSAAGYYLVKSGVCTAPPLTELECAAAAAALGIPIQNTPVSKKRMPGGCFAKTNNEKGIDVKVRWNAGATEGANCGFEAQDGKFTLSCVCALSE